jgi:hypothetical protein
MIIAMPLAGFRYTKGTPKQFTQSDLERPATREFCANCGTHILGRGPDSPIVGLKVGTLDDPKQYGDPQIAVFLIDKQSFHRVPEGIPTFERTPGRDSEASR